MPNLYMLVGLPGSGKSTVAQELEGKIFSSDELRKQIYGKENHVCTKEENAKIFIELHKQIKECLKNGESCIYDATNINAKKRQNFLQELNKIGCKKICVLVATDYDICLKNNESRERKVPTDVIKRMYMTFNIPQYREGWDEIIIKRTRDKNKDYDIFKYIDYLEDIPHENPHHLLSIGGHIQAVVKDISDKYLLKFAGDIERLENLLRAALYHDVGKEFTKTYINSKGEETEVAHYYYHENVSAYMYIMYENDFELDNSENIKKILYIADLIGLHMRLNHSGMDVENIKQTLIKLVGKREFEDLCIINESDKLCS